MPEFRRHVTIDRPRQNVWDFITNPANAKTWMPNLKSIEVITDGAAGVGTKYRETRNFNGRDATAEIEVTAWEAPAIYAAGARYANTLFEYRYHLSAPTETSTELELIASAKPKGIVGKLAAIPMLKMMQKVDGEHLQSIKQALEAS